jgi:predicted transcriptional regulator
MAEDLLALTAQIVSAHVMKNAVEVADLPALIRDVFRTLSGLGEAAPAPAADTAKPAVPAARSVFASHIICMECGKLMTEHGLTIDQYRSKYSLPGTYPMVAPDYAKTRSSLAKEMGLGKSRGAVPKKAGRRK